MDVIITPDNERHVVGQLRDLEDLIDAYIGEDAKKWLTEYISDIKAVAREDASIEEGEIREQVAESYTGVLRELRELSEELATEIRQPRLDRRRISNIAGSIGKITYRNT